MNAIERESNERLLALLQAGTITLQEYLKDMCGRPSAGYVEDIGWHETPEQRQFGDIREIARSTSDAAAAAREHLKGIFPICNTISKSGKDSESMYIADQMVEMFVAGAEFQRQITLPDIKVVDVNRLETVLPPHWKPTKEQLDTMKLAVAYFSDSWTSKAQRNLESLYYDLKKLYHGRDSKENTNEGRPR